MAEFSEAKTRFTAQDKVTKSFRDMEKGAKRFGAGAKKSFRDASAGASRFGSITKGILAAGVIQRGLGLLSQGIGNITRQFISFDDSITAASAKFTDINLATAEGQQSMEALRVAARKTGADTEFSATQASSALDFLAMAGFSSTQAMASLPGVVDLATASGLGLAEATDIASDSLGAFGLMSKDTAKLQANLTRINDVFAKTATSANVTVEQLFATVKKGAPDFTNAGQSIETFAALAGTMAGSGIKAEEAGTQLRNTIVNLSATTPAADAALKRLGVTVEDSEGKFRDVVDIFADLQKGLKGVKSDTEKTALITNIFGKRSSGLKVLLSANIGELRKYRKSLVDAGGAAAEMAAIMRGSLGNQIKTLQSAAIELGFKIFGAFKNQGEGAVLSFTEAVRKFDPEPIIQGLDFMIGLFKNFWAILKPFVPFMPWFIGIWAAYATVMGIIGFAQAITGFIALTAAAMGTTGVMATLNAVMIANPIGAIVFGIVLLIAAIVWLVKNFDMVAAAWDWMWDKMKLTFFRIVNVFSILWGGIIEGILRGVRAVAGFMGGDTSGIDMALDKLGQFQADISAKAEGRTAPNEQEAAARNEAGFKGRIDIAGAPEGSTASGDSFGSADIDMGMLGGA